MTPLTVFQDGTNCIQNLRRSSRRDHLFFIPKAELFKSVSITIQLSVMIFLTT